MRYRPLLPSLLTLGAFGLVACGEETTQPNTAVDQPTAPQLAVTSNTWLTRRDMPLDLINQATAVVPNAAGQSILYAIGGAKADSPSPGSPVPMGEVRAYNVATDTWTSKRDMPAVRYDMKAEVINGKIYVPGGFTNQHRATASLYVYDPASNTWSRKRDMPAAGGSGVTGVIRGKLYVLTFSRAWDPVVYFFRYDPTRDSWTKLPSPTDYPWLNVGGGVMYEKLYVTGYTQQEQSRVLQFDPVTSRWTQKRPWSSPSCLPGFSCHLFGPTAIMQAHLYVFGTEWAYRASRGIFIYEPLSDTWERKPLLTTLYWAEYELSAARVFLNGKPRAEIIGGWDHPGNNQQYIP